MIRYDPFSPPKPDEWLSLGENDRLESIAAYHTAEGTKLPNPRLHAALHAIVENQLAMALVPVIGALKRLMEEGLDRHDAIHAIASVLANHMYGALQNPDSAATLTDEYVRSLSHLTAARWRAT